MQRNILPQPQIDPRIYLAVDNCFALKRWTAPAEWMGIAKKIGLRCVQASADNECDPLYMDPGYLKDWLAEIEQQTRKTGVRVSNFYSGHESYATLGLSHTDARVRKRMRDRWLKPLALQAGQLGAGIGFFCHAFPESVLQDPALYQQFEASLYDALADIAVFCYRHRVKTASVEQMYTPHQVPWTIRGAKKLLREVNQRSRKPFYVTLDTGHQVGQARYLRPDSLALLKVREAVQKGQGTPGCWLGPLKAWDLIVEKGRPAQILDRIEDLLDKYPYLFSQPEDSELTRWLEELGCYSPIIHLQQTTGRSSEHLAFTPDNNVRGTIQADRVLQAIARSYGQPWEPAMPPRCSKIYLTLEIFSSTADINRDILERMKASADYWRKVIPRDGVKLSQLIKRL